MGKKSTKETLADETDKLIDQTLEQEVDGIIAGFPCQDIAAKTGSGLSGHRSGLFWELIGTIRLVRPKYILLENVAALFWKNRKRDSYAIFGSLAECGYDIEWDCISAASVGAPYFRARAYILGKPPSLGKKRCFPQTLQRQPEFAAFENIRNIKDLRDRPEVFGRTICGNANGLAERLHGIGNGNPPCIIRELTKDLK